MTIGGVQIVIESDIFFTEYFILRKTFNGYSILVSSEGSDNEGVFEYDFDKHDMLCKEIDDKIRTALEKALDT